MIDHKDRIVTPDAHLVTGQSRPPVAASSVQAKPAFWLRAINPAWGAFALALAAGVVALIVRIAISPGVALDDEISHYLFSLNGWTYPEALLHTWARVGNTLAYMPAAILGGFEGRRVMAVLLVAVSCVFAALIARRLGVRRLWVIPLAACFQSWVMLAGAHGLTQQPFMLALTVGVWAALTGRRPLAAVCFGLLALIRHEGIGLTGAYMLYAAAERATARDVRGVILAVLMAGLPLIVYNVAYYAVMGVWASGNLLSLVPTTEYGSGGWLHFVPQVAAGIGLPVLIVAACGIIPAVRLRVRVLVFAPYVLYFLVHTVIYRFGLFASGGYGIFLLPLAPAVAILAALGIDALAARLDTLFSGRAASQRIARTLHQAGVVALAGGVMAYGLLTPTFAVEPVHVALRDAATWMTEYHTAHPDAEIAAAHVAFWRYYDPTFNTPHPDWNYFLPDLADRALVVWDARYSAGHGADWATLTDPANGWQRAAAFNMPLDAAEPVFDGIMVFERGQNG